MRKKYISPRAKVMSGSDIGFALVDRLSTIFVKSAQKIDWHRHDETEIICCLKGSPTYEFRNRPPVTLTSGCFLVVPIGLEHRLADGIDGPCRRFSFFLKKPRRQARGTSPVSVNEMREILSLLLKKRLRPHIIRESAILQVARLANLLDSTPVPTLIEQLTARADALSAILTLASTQKNPTFKNKTRLMDEAVVWLKRHYSEQVKMDQLITYMGYSRSLFFTLFKSHTGQTPVEWLTQFRIKRAKRLLVETESSIGEIATSCGFADPAFFTRTFRRCIGLSPTKFRDRSR